MMLLTQRTTWKKLEKHSEKIQFAQNIRNTPKIICTDDITLDYSHQKIDDKALALLWDLADECQVKQAISQLMTGQSVNHTLPALHTALRAFDEEDAVWLNGTNVINDVLTVREQMRNIAGQIRNGTYLGHTNKAITNIVNIGIGGSMLGPQFCIDALASWTDKNLSYFFISDMDATAFDRVVAKLDPETTLFIVSSKSFTTTETLLNASKALQWIACKKYCSQHFIAITAHPERAQQLGFEQILPIWSWVGGRYSVCSAINLITCIAVGYEHFIELLQGAHHMDIHCRQADIPDNLPIMLALLGIWNNNNAKIHNLLILTYAQSLQWFTPYLQQLEMESNGKSLDKQGRDLNYASVPIIWGGSGNQAQHSYFQMLYQGTQQVCADLISLAATDTQLLEQHKKSLMLGISDSHPCKPMSFNHLTLSDGSPRTIGALIALYEHKVFVQSVIWNINPFDQPGVDQMKQTIRSSCDVFA